MEIAKHHNPRSFNSYRRRARDLALTLNEKCDVPEAWRRGKSESIFADIASKLTLLGRPGARICDIGAGCSDLTHHIIEYTAERNQSLTVIDCPEMLELLPSPSHLTKIAGRFPDCAAMSSGDLGLFDAILSYSVLQCVFSEGDVFSFVDSAASLLSEGGQLLIGDVANATMRKRFMASDAGKAYHREYYSHLPEPEIVFNKLELGEIDDGVVLGLITRMRAAGLHAFVVPQAPGLPMANRREDILILKP